MTLLTVSTCARSLVRQIFPLEPQIFKFNNILLVQPWQSGSIICMLTVIKMAEFVPGSFYWYKPDCKSYVWYSNHRLIPYTGRS